MFKEDLFKDKTVLVTGGGTGIGKEIAAQFLKAGATVFICGRKEEKLREAIGELSLLGPCFEKSTDIRDTSQINELAAFIKEKKGRLDILINNAGGQFLSPAEQISEKGWLAVINNNLNGTWFVTQTMANQFFIPQNEGKIITIIVNIYRGFPGMVHTGAARAGVDNMTKSLAVEWSKYNIQINAIAPGIILSSGLDNYPPKMLDGLAENIPAKRLGRVDEVASLTLFLTTKAADYLTGDTIYIDGGQHLHGSPYLL
ncbi:MAG: SDR family oxidoreductase [Bacteroidetes bacterium]|nr:SDR family oxidoreductase [Bacteroidota bacterium]